MKKIMVVTRDGTNVSVTTGGGGPPLVFLHGFSVSTEAYLEMLEMLVDFGFQVYGIDAPNHGGTDTLGWGHTVEDMAIVIDDVLTQLAVAEGALIAGHSMGGWLAAEVAARRPWRYKALVMLNAAVGDQFHEQTRLTGLRTLVNGARFLAGGVLDVAGDAKAAGSLRTATERLSLISRLASSVSGPGIIRAAYAMMKSSSHRALERVATIPSVVVHGTADQMISVESATSAAKRSGSAMVHLPGLFHSWMISDPALAASVLHWVYLSAPPPQGMLAAS